MPAGGRPYTGRMSALAWLVIAVVALSAVACSATPVGAVPHAGGDQRMVLTWHRAVPADAASTAVLEAELSRVAGVPVRVAATIGPQSAAVVLACAAGAACAEAERRLRADARVIDLTSDGRRRSHGAAPVRPTPP